MTHDKLLAKLLVTDKTNMTTEVIKWQSALFAVVELHKPIEEGGKLWCQQEDCYNHVEFLERDDCSCDYPCPTIQAIEKELSE